MAVVIILGLIIFVLTLTGICSLDEGGSAYFFGFDAFCIILLLFVIFGCESPKFSATDEIVSSEEIKLADIQTEDGQECYVLRNSEGRYYFITEVEDEFGKGHSSFKEMWIDGTQVIVNEDDTSLNGAYVRVDECNAKVTFESLGIKPVKAYTFVVPSGTIVYTKDLPESK